MINQNQNKLTKEDQVGALASQLQVQHYNLLQEQAVVHQEGLQSPNQWREDSRSLCCSLFRGNQFSSVRNTVKEKKRGLSAWGIHTKAKEKGRKGRIEEEESEKREEGGWKLWCGTYINAHRRRTKRRQTLQIYRRADICFLFPTPLILIFSWWNPLPLTHSDLNPSCTPSLILLAHPTNFELIVCSLGGSEMSWDSGLTPEEEFNFVGMFRRSGEDIFCGIFGRIVVIHFFRRRNDLEIERDRRPQGVNIKRRERMLQRIKNRNHDPIRIHATMRNQQFKHTWTWTLA